MPYHLLSDVPKTNIKMGVENCELRENGGNDQLPDKVEVAIKKIIKKEGYTDYEVLIRAMSTVGGNYFGSLYEVDVKGKTEDGEKETNIFVKGIVPGDHLTVVSVTGMFNMELFFYNELAVVFDELQSEAKVPLEERYNIAKTFQESIPEAIIMENLARKGYTTVYRMDPISFKFAELCIVHLGKLHALSFALEKKRPSYFERKIKSISCPFNFNEDYHALFNNSAKVIAECLDDGARGRFVAYLPKLLEKIPKYLCDKNYKRTLIHGDYRANNILMKEVGGEVVDVVPVDYQLQFYGCPLIDFFYFIFSGTDQQFRKVHLEDLKDIYFDSLTKMLNFFDIEVKSVFPREDFENLYREMIDFGLHSFVQLMPFIFTVEDEVPGLDKDNLADIVIKTDPVMKDRARGIVDDFIRWGIL